MKTEIFEGVYGKGIGRKCQQKIFGGNDTKSKKMILNETNLYGIVKMRKEGTSSEVSFFLYAKNKDEPTLGTKKEEV